MTGLGECLLKLLKIFAALVLLLPLLSACGDTGNVANDGTSAQRLLPNLGAYTATDVDASVDGAFAAVGGAALVGGQIGITAAIAKIEQVLQCFQDRGAIAARYYQESDMQLTAPRVGAALVINQTRVNQELVNCILGGQEGGASAQSFSIEPCSSAGTLAYAGDTISYVYIGSHPDVCAIFQLHFDNLAATEAET